MSWLLYFKTLSLLAVGLFSLSACTPLSNRDYAQQLSRWGGIDRVAVFVQRWPVYLQLQGESGRGESFINQQTPFSGAWEQAGQVNPRAVDIMDIDNAVMEKLLLQVLKNKGYQPVIAGFTAISPKSATVAEIMARYRMLDPNVNAFLFCFYSPTLFFADPKATPKDHWCRTYSLGEIIQILNPGKGSVIWAGRRAARAPNNSITHAFIYVSLTVFEARTWQPLIKVADSHIGGKLWYPLRLDLPRCPPAPTDKDYWVDAALIQRLMCRNLKCRLRHLIPDAL